MIFRELTIKDYEKLIPFWKSNYFVNEMDNAERFKLFLEKNPHLSILAEEEGQIVGTALGSFDGRRGYIQKVVVEQKFRRKGVGQQLMKMIIQKLQALDCTYIPLNVEKELLEFYKDCGFKETEQISMNMSLSDDGSYHKYVNRKRIDK